MGQSRGRETHLVIALWSLIECELVIGKRRDLVVDGYEYRKLCFVESGFVSVFKCFETASGFS
jgi:hypothetical protein